MELHDWKEIKIVSRKPRVITKNVHRNKQNNTIKQSFLSDMIVDIEKFGKFYHDYKTVTSDKIYITDIDNVSFCINTRNSHDLYIDFNNWECTKCKITYFSKEKPLPIKVITVVYVNASYSFIPIEAFEGPPDCGLVQISLVMDSLLL